MNALEGVLVAVASIATVTAALSVHSRIRFARRPQAFRCRLARSPGRHWGRHARWRLTGTRALWVSDVLLVQSGLLRLGVTAMAPRLGPAAKLRPLSADDVPRLGPHPVGLTLLVDGEHPLEIAVARKDRTLVVGPYLVAALPGLPRVRGQRDH